ncbi:MAG: VCBS repeat-containing protein [Phycisphaerales bacterium]|nr:VCBS repeat-containing protein [Phycisphaerales bacterium]
MRTAFILASVSTTSLLASGAWAQNWIDLVNQTSTRLVAPTSMVVNDNLEKDFGWGDFDQDGDVDIAVMRKFPGSIQGGFPNLLLMNEGGVLTDRTDEYATDSDEPGYNGFLDATNDREVEVVDVNGDGWLDLVTCTTMSDQVNDILGQPRVYINKGNDGQGNWLGFRFENERIPTLFAKNGSSANPRFCDLSVGDLTGDGYPDLFFTDYDTPETSGTICIDLNGDGDTNDPGECQQSPGESSSKDYDNKFLVNWGNDPNGPGPGHFYDSTNTRMTSSQLASAFGNATFMADMNDDGVLDVVRVNTLTGGQNVATLYNKTEALQGLSFSGPDQAVAGAPYNIDAADLNNDGKMDMVVVDDSKDKFLINTGNGADGFANFTSYTINDSVTEFGNTVHCADLDNDGLADVVICDVDADLPPFCPNSGRRAKIYRNTGGTPSNNMLDEIGQVIPNGSLTSTYDIAPVDLDGDGWLDLVVGRCAGIQIWMNVPPIALSYTYPDGIPTSLVPDEPATFTVQTSIIGGGQIVPGSMKLFASVDGGPFSDSLMTDLGAGLFEATVPATACGTGVKFYVSGDLTNGPVFNDPPGAPAEFYLATAIDRVETVFADDIEGDVSGWLVENASGASGGWEAVVPVGTANAGQPAAPSEDASANGTMAWVTQNGSPGGSAGLADVDGGPHVLTTPAFSLDGQDGIVSYYRWFYCDDAGAVGADELLVEISNDGGASWTTVETVTTNAGDWAYNEFLASAYVAPSANMLVRFTIDDSPNNSVTEAGVDEFHVEALICDGTGCIGDLDGNGVIDGADLGALLAQWGGSGNGDLDGSGAVDGADLGALLAAWGNCP